MAKTKKIERVGEFIPENFDVIASKLNEDFSIKNKKQNSCTVLPYRIT